MTIAKKFRRRSTRQGFVCGVLCGGVLCVLLAGAVVTAATVSAAPTLAEQGIGYRFGGRLLRDPETAQKRAHLAVEFILGRVDATEAQQAEAKQIVSDTLNDLIPLAEQHRANRDALRTELRQVNIDTGAIEQLRQNQMALAESASRELTAALTSFAGTLSAEQRSELIEMAQHFRR